MSLFKKYHFFQFNIAEIEINFVFDELFLHSDYIPPNPILHHHETWELYCVTEGTMKLSIENQIVEIASNHILFIPPYTSHCILHGSADQLHTSIRFWLSGDSNESKNTLEAILNSSALKSLSWTFSNNSRLQEIKTLYQDYISNSKSIWLSSRISAISQLFFIDVLEVIAPNPPSQLAKKGNHDNTPMLLEYLMLYSSENDITLPQLAKALNYSNEQTTRIIKKKFGKPFRSLIRDIKIEKAKIFLTQSDFKIEEIANNLGFETVKSFNASFQDSVGMSPTVYRQQNQQKNIDSE
ncbi:MAG: AraC family transcriptional regulator [Clostridia bacterium]|nr:AraC family transcriptional regulator [Clostridia bacterium]